MMDYCSVETGNLVLPRPCDGPYYNGWTLNDWLLKVCEECGEAVTAAKYWKKSREKIKWFIREYPGENIGEEKEAAFRALSEEAHKDRTELCEELTDVITAATSVLEFIGCDANHRAIVQDRINRRNGERDGGTRFSRVEGGD